jgi:hypothetical protein
MLSIARQKYQVGFCWEHAVQLTFAKTASVRVFYCLIITLNLCMQNAFFHITDLQSYTSCYMPYLSKKLNFKQGSFLNHAQMLHPKPVG